MGQALIRFWIADHRSTMAAAGEISYAVLVGAETTLNGTAAELPEGSAVKPPSAVIAAVRTGGRILVAGFRVTQVAWRFAQNIRETSCLTFCPFLCPTTAAAPKSKPDTLHVFWQLGTHILAVYQGQRQLLNSPFRSISHLVGFNVSGRCQCRLGLLTHSVDS